MTSKFGFEFKTIVDFAESISAVDFSEFIESIQYQGFNPASLAQHIYKIAAGNSGEIKMMVILGIERGNNIKSILDSVTESGKEQILKLQKKYSIMSQLNRRARFNCITLSRVALVFPWLSCEYMADSQNAVVKVSQMQSKYHDYPSHMCHPSFASMIPNDDSISTEIKEILIILHSYHQMEFSAVISSNNKSVNKILASDVIRFICAGQRNNFIPSAFRVKKLKEWRIIFESKGGFHLRANLKDLYTKYGDVTEVPVSHTNFNLT